MELTLARIGAARSHAKSAAANQLAEDFIARAARYLPCAETTHPSEAALLQWAEKHAGRTRPFLLLLDPRGQALTSDQFAARLGSLRDSGTQTLVLAIGPPDGWSDTARRRADLVLSFGPITLPHELARVVAAEQIYRALTILAGHPYHCGH